MESLGFKHPWYDPYNQNQLKADKPVRGKDWFLNLLGISDTLIEPRSIPTPAAPQSPSETRHERHAGRYRSADRRTDLHRERRLLQGRHDVQTAGLRIQGTLAFNYNRVRHRRNARADGRPDLRRNARRRLRRCAGTVLHLGLFQRTPALRFRRRFPHRHPSRSPSDFRGFLFQDNQLGVRFFGTRDSNRWQYNFGGSAGSKKT